MKFKGNGSFSETPQAKSSTSNKHKHLKNIEDLGYDYDVNIILYFILTKYNKHFSTLSCFCYF